MVTILIFFGGTTHKLVGQSDSAFVFFKNNNQKQIKKSKRKIELLEWSCQCKQYHNQWKDIGNAGKFPPRSMAFELARSSPCPGPCLCAWDVCLCLFSCIYYDIYEQTIIISGNVDWIGRNAFDIVFIVICFRLVEQGNWKQKQHQQQQNEYVGWVINFVFDLFCFYYCWFFVVVIFHEQDTIEVRGNGHNVQGITESSHLNTFFHQQDNRC